MTRMMTVAAAVISMCVLVLAAEPAKNLLAPTNKPDSWRFEQHEQGKGSMKPEANAMVFTITEIDGTDWHVQAARPNLELKDAQAYTLTFSAKADAERAIGVNAMIDQDDYHPAGLGETADLTREWKQYSFDFTAENVAPMKKNRITLVLGGDKGTVWVREMTLVEKQ